MSDERLRGLRRRWEQTHSLEDESAYLGERLRVGELSPLRLDLAAFLGHPAAMSLCSRRPPTGPGFVGPWVRDLTEWGIEPPLWAGVTAQAFLFRARLDPPLPAPYREKQGEACRRVVAWLRDPSPDRLARALALDTGWDAFEGIQALATLNRVGEGRLEVAVQEAARHGQSLAEKVLQRLVENVVREQLGRPLITEVSVSSFPPMPEPSRTPGSRAAMARYEEGAKQIEEGVDAQLRGGITLRLLDWALA